VVNSGLKHEGVPCKQGAGILAGRIRREGKRRLAKSARWVQSDEEGSSLVEFAISIPVLLTFFFGLIQVCIATYTRSALSECAREGTRYAMVHGATCQTPSNASCTLTAAAMNTYVSSSTWPNVGGGAMTVNTTYPDGNENPGSRVQVTVTYAFPFRVPMIPASTLTMTSTSVMYIVQ
jgi:Flp pilus assembly protein TadG